MKIRIKSTKNNESFISLLIIKQENFDDSFQGLNKKNNMYKMILEYIYLKISLFQSKL